ncbi:DUF5776 domain-containing protein [Apilactobacillus ozensis]|uniref:DUF5776 domain-containing protein n=1 Tax=Apilactobacillus ozensis TaxID=866801 RepID=UPI0034E27C3C
MKSYHDDALSNQNGKLGYNHIFKADRIVKIGNVTRIHLVDGSYVTGNKKFVNIITK